MNNTIDESFFSEQGDVMKIMHLDGSETAIKTVLSQAGRGTDRIILKERNKYSVFVSASSGCFMKCSFCHLTAKCAPYSKIDEDCLFANVTDAMTHAAANGMSIAGRFLKISWMGMGEDAFMRPAQTRRLSSRIASWAIGNNLAAGLDGVDLSTVIPAVPRGWRQEFCQLNRELGPFPENPANSMVDQAEEANFDTYSDRTRFRLFYSLHSAVQETRDRMIPKAVPIAKAMDELRLLSEEETPPNIIFHHSFIRGENDSQKEIDALLRLFDEAWTKGRELRILRYNHCDASEYYESDEFKGIIAKIAKDIPKLKVQTSLGSEVAAACGQFIVAAYAKPKESDK